jgi:hypothetical protein
MQIMRLFILLLTALTVSACVSTNTKRVEPESLLNSSKEDVSFELVNNDSIGAIVKWVNDDKPTGAQLNCNTKGKQCQQAQKILKSRLIPFKVAKPATDTPESVKLLYARVSAKDCSSNLLGCSVSVNSLQMVTDHNTFVAPSLSDQQDAAKAIRGYNRYLGN